MLHSWEAVHVGACVALADRQIVDVDRRGTQRARCFGSGQPRAGSGPKIESWVPSGDASALAKLDPYGFALRALLERGERQVVRAPSDPRGAWPRTRRRAQPDRAKAAASAQLAVLLARAAGAGHNRLGEEEAE